MERIALRSRMDRIVAVVFLSLAFLTSVGCDDGLSTEDAGVDARTSMIDGKPVLRFSGITAVAGKVSTSAYRLHAEKVRDDLLKFGPDIITAFRKSEGAHVPVKEISNRFSTHLEIDFGNDQEEVLLTIFDPSVDGESGSATAVYLVLDPSTFYSTEDETGSEVWPVTAPAYSLRNVPEEIEVTFGRHGIAGLPENSRLIYLTPVAVLNEESPKPVRMQDPPASTAGKSAATQPALSIKKLRLEDTGDGSGAAELLVHQQGTDDYTSRFSRIWEHRFDEVWGCTAYLNNGCKSNTGNDGITYTYAPAQFASYPDYFLVPDVNAEDVDYSFANLPVYEVDDYGTYVFTGYKDYFPMFWLSSTPYRLIVHDNDDNYDEFSRLQQSEWAGYVQTYDMSTGTSSSVYTKVNANYDYTGKSDDIHPTSGARRITFGNADNRSGGGLFDITSNAGAFRYTFVLEYLDPYQSY